MKELPDIELVSARVHESWVMTKKTQGFNSRKAEDGEELMVPYEQLIGESQTIGQEYS